MKLSPGCWLALFAGLPLAACGGPQRNVLFVTIDTLRKDHLGAYGASVETPTLDGLAAEGVRFDDAFTTAPTTLPAHTSLFTGTYPHRHGVRRNGLHVVPDDALTLAELFRSSGYTTAAFVGTAVLDGVYGLQQGFEVYEDEMRPEDSAAQSQRKADRVVDAACEWLATEGGPFFLWVHVFDPHGPYDPPAPFDRMYYEGDERDPKNRSLESVPVVFYQNLEGITDVEFPRAQYKAEVSYTDQAIGRLLEALGDRAAETLVVVTADHGESLGENHYWFDHGETLTEDCVRVPLIVRAPWTELAGTVVGGPVSHVDVAPTLLELLGLDPGHRFDGISLVPHLESGVVPDRRIFYETFLKTSVRKRPLFGVQTAGAKLTLIGDRARLYESDDSTLRDDALRDELRAVLEEYAAREPSWSQEELPMTPDRAEMLKDLGYL